MLSVGLAASYAPSMFRQASEWPRIHRALTHDVPQPVGLAAETPSVVQEHIDRIHAGFAAMRAQIEAASVDALVMLGSDNGRVFTGVQIPQFCTYLGEEIWGSTRLAELGEKPEDIVRLRCARDLASFIQRELVAHGFDLNYSETLSPRGQPEYGTIPEFVAPAKRVLPSSDIPVVPMYVNTQVSPAPSGRRCYALGRELGEVLAERPERVGLFASGGLAHDHHGPRAGWLDEPLDRWVLDQISRGKGAALQPMFDVESDTLKGGASQIRLWAIVAGAAEAFGARARVVDYIPSYTAAAGIAFAYWPVSAG